MSKNILPFGLACRSASRGAQTVPDCYVRSEPHGQYGKIYNLLESFNVICVGC